MVAQVEIVRYSGVRTCERHPTDPNGHVASSGLRASLVHEPVSGDLVVRAEAIAPVEGFGIDLVLTWPGWSGGYVLVPGAVYDGNRFEVLDVPYPPMYAATRSDERPLVTDVPRLPAFDLLAGDASYPALGLLHPERGLATAVLFPAQTDLGDVGLRVEEGSHGLTVRIGFPGVRPRRYTMVRTDTPSVDRSASVAAGWSMEVRIAVIEAPATSVDDLFALLDRHRNRIEPEGELPALRPLSSVAGLVAEAAMKEGRWIEDPGFYSTADSDHGTPFQVGWTGGGITSFAVDESLRGGERAPLAAERARRNLDFIVDALQAPSGFFCGGWGEGEIVNDGFGQPHAEHWAMVRKSGDMLLFLMRAILAADVPSPRWHEAARRCAEALVRNGDDWGQFVDVRTGEVVVRGSACGGTAIAGLVLAAGYFDEPRFLRCAAAAADRYAARCIATGLLTGGPGEILNAPDSESAFGLLEGAVALWEATGEDRWLDLAERTARQAASWVVPYDFPFPAESTFGRMGMRATGTVIANVQNKHSAPGICTGSALPLVKLFRATGVRRYLDLAVAISRSLPQYVSSDERPIVAEDGRPMPSGWTNERVNMSDWEMPERGLGEVYCGPCWPMPTVLLTALEMPGVYVDPAQDLVACADHIEAHLDGNALRITNPTPHDARVRVLVDHDPARPLGELWWRTTSPVLIPAGETVEIGVDAPNAIERPRLSPVATG